MTQKYRYKLARYLRKIANRIASKGKNSGITFPDIGAEHLPKNAPRALIFFAAAGIQRLVEGKGLDDQIFKHHTIHGDAVAMVQELNRLGYIVDYCDLRKVIGKNVGWQKYKIVIDNWDNLRYASPVTDQVKIAFMNGMHWLFHNTAELERIRWFRERTGILIPANRQIPPILSDEYADYLTYYGNKLQGNSFSNKPSKYLINLCALYGPMPLYQKKNIAEARNKFMWIGGGGMIHKGLDVVIEAFVKLPEAELFIAGNLREEPHFWQWAEPILAKYANIHLLGWVDTTSAEFNATANQCIGAVFASAAEGGPASVARVLFNGQIPIVTPSSAVRAECLGYNIDGKTDKEMIESIISTVRQTMNLPELELKEKSDAIREYALKYHTREAFAQSFSNLIKHIT